jgi:RNA polymerase sigma-70 factor (ECF subfamily)
MEISDEQLLEMFKNENSRNYAFNLIIRKYQKRIYQHVRRMVINHDDTDDIVQETFIKSWKGLHKFEGNAALYTWIYRIATNQCLTFLAQKRKRFFLPINDVEADLKHQLITDNAFSGDQIQLLLQQAILTLPEKQRLIFNMKYYDELKYEEISEIVNTSVGALKASYHHAVKKIEEYLSNIETN